MISEHDFISSYSSIWRQLTHRADGYWKIENHLTEIEYPRMSAVAPREMRGAVNETAFRSFCVLRSEIGPDDVSHIDGIIDSQIAGTLDYVARFAPSMKTASLEFNEACREESRIILERMLDYFPKNEGIIVRPTFPGCGTISACEGDILAGDCLYEIKAGDRAFRISDLRQLLVYSALAFASGSLTFVNIGLFNPRTGHSWLRSLDEVCLAISGRKSIDTLAELTMFFSSISESY